MADQIMQEIIRRLRKQRGAHPVFQVAHIVGRLKMALSNINAAQRKIHDDYLDNKLSEAKKAIEEVLSYTEKWLKSVREER